MTWDKITVKQFYEIMEILKEDDGLDPIMSNCRLIDCIWNISSADISAFRLSYYLDELKFLQKPYEPKEPKKEYVINGVTFVPTLDLTKMTTSQYIDFQELIKRDDHKHLLNALFIKKGENYGESDNSDLLWENLSLPDYADVQFFFLRLWKKLMTATLTSSTKIIKKMCRKEKNKEKKEEMIAQLAAMKTLLLDINEDGSLG